jgi:hypothetical protein
VDPALQVDRMFKGVQVADRLRCATNIFLSFQLIVFRIFISMARNLSADLGKAYTAIVVPKVESIEPHLFPIIGRRPFEICNSSVYFQLYAKGLIVKVAADPRLSRKCRIASLPEWVRHLFKWIVS